MVEPASIDSVAQAYRDAVKTLLAPAGMIVTERGGRGPASAQDLQDQAQEVLPLSMALGQASLELLQSGSPTERLDSATRLLALSLTDMQISNYCLQTVTEAERGGRSDQLDARDRAVHQISGMDGPLAMIVEPGGQPARMPQRAPTTLGAARGALEQEMAGALLLIRDRAAAGGQLALEGVLGLGMADAVQSAVQVGANVMAAMGQAGQLVPLQGLFRRYAAQAVDTLVKLLGRDLVKPVATMVSEWLEKLGQGDRFAGIVESLYETRLARTELADIVRLSDASVDQLNAKTASLARLNTGFGQQMTLVSKLVPAVGIVRLVPAAILPQGQLIALAAYVVLGGYAVLAGADYVDAPRVRLVNRVSGVRDTVRSLPGLAQEAV